MLESFFANMLLGYDDEAAFEHPILVLAKGKGSLFVVPATSNGDRKEKSYKIVEKEGEESISSK